MTGIKANVEKHFPNNAKAIWFDATHAGYVISSPLVAHQIWALALADLSATLSANIRDMLVLEIGSDYAAQPESKAAAWLNSHGAQRKVA